MEMIVWSRIPFVRICLVLIVGILLEPQLAPTLYSFSLSKTLLFLLGGCIVLLIGYRLGKRNNLLVGILILLLICLIGLIRSYHYNFKDRKNTFQAFEGCSAYTAHVKSYPIKKEKYHSYLLESIHIKTDSTITKRNERIQLYVPIHSDNIDLNYGDIIEIKGSPSQIQGPKNPHDFNYASYMANDRIFLKGYAHPMSIRIIAHHQGNAILAAVYRLRSHFESIIVSGINSPKERGVALALLLGIKDKLDKSTKDSYSAVGAMHILAVSGLHVGVIHFLILFLFKPFKLYIVKRYFLPIMSIGSLWCYAMLTGFSPSILRAVTMFSIIILGNALNRRSNIYNSIAISAFLLLMINPNQIYQVGFQLSYLAVLGIVYIHPKIYQLWSPNSWVLDKIFTISSVSLAAQIATAPISILYFGQFPNYFLLSNLIVIPAAFLMMAEGLILLIMNSIYTMSWVGEVMKYTIQSVNQIITMIHEFPGSVTEWFYLSKNQVILLYLLQLFVLIFTATKKFKFVWVIVLGAVLFSGDRCYRLFIQSERSGITFYHHNHTIIEQFENLSTQLYSMDTTESVSFNSINNHRLAHQLDPINNPVSFITEDTSNQVIKGVYASVMNGKKILFLTDKISKQNLKQRISADFVVVENDAIQSIHLIDSIFDYDKVIFGHSNSRPFIRRMKSKHLSDQDSVIFLDDGLFQINF